MNFSIPSQVPAEDGGHAYFPGVAIENGLPLQSSDPNVAAVIERRENLAALRAHLDAAQMAAFRDRTAAMVAAVSLKVLQEA